MHKMDAATNELGYEIADIVLGKQKTLPKNYGGK